MKTLTIILIVSLIAVIALMVFFKFADPAVILNNMLLLTILFFIALGMAIISFLIVFIKGLKEERQLFPTPTLDSSIADYQAYAEGSY